MRIVAHDPRGQRMLKSLAGLTALAFVATSLVAGEHTAGSGQNGGQERAKASAPADQSLADQLRRLQKKVAELEAALKQKHQGKKPTAALGSGMKMGNMPMGSGAKGGTMQGKGMSKDASKGKGMRMGMGMMGQGMMGQGKMSSQGAMSKNGRSGKGQMGGMEMMGRMKGMKAMGGKKPAQPLPGFPGAPGIYHIGATGFFLDQAEKISLSPEQQAALKKVRDEAMSEQATFEEQIEKAEEQLGELTGSDQPDAAKIEAKVREIERLRADRRLAFIRAVGRAASVLTDEQRKMLTQNSEAPAQEPAKPKRAAR